VEFLGVFIQQKPRPAVPHQREAEAARNTSDVDVEKQLLGESAGVDGLADGPLPDVPLPEIPISDIPLPDSRLSDVPLPEEHPDGSVGDD
jgi:hypothetical protein